VRRAEHKGFGDLLRYPFCRWMRRHIDPDQLSPRQSNDDEGVEQLKANGRTTNKSMATMCGI
jgi:hypothetical protein